MSKITPNQIFLVGFIIGVFIFFSINFYDFSSRYTKWCSDCDSGFGFPFRLHEPGGIANGQGILFFGLVADFIIALIFSFILGLIFKFVWSKIAARKLN